MPFTGLQSLSIMSWSTSQASGGLSDLTDTSTVGIPWPENASKGGGLCKLLLVFAVTRGNQLPSLHCLTRNKGPLTPEKTHLVMLEYELYYPGP